MHITCGRLDEQIQCTFNPDLRLCVDRLIDSCVQGRQTDICRFSWLRFTLSKYDTWKESLPVPHMRENWPWGPSMQCMDWSILCMKKDACKEMCTYIYTRENSPQDPSNHYAYNNNNIQPPVEWPPHFAHHNDQLSIFHNVWRQLQPLYMSSKSACRRKD